MVNNNQTNLLDILTGTKKIVPSTSKNEVKTDKEKKTDTNKEKNMGGRIPKNEKYTEERKQLLNKILKILNITKENNTFFINELEKDDAKKQQILELVDDIKKYFSCCSWVYFSKTHVPHPLTSLIKSILKDMNVKSNSVSIRDNATNRVDKKGHKIHV